MQCLKLFENETSYSIAHHRICFNISVEIRKFILAEKAKKVQAVENNLSRCTLTEASHARARYVGGYCIAKMRHKYINKKACHRFLSKPSAEDIYQNAKCALNILDCIIIDEQGIHSTPSEPGSLVDVSKRQNLHRGLTNITDRLFKFFINLTVKCLGFFIDKNVNILGADMFKVCQKQILSSIPLYEEFLRCCTEKEEVNMDDMSIEGIVQSAILKVSQYESIYESVIKHYIMVMLNQFRKDALDVLQVERNGP
ncbi:hypothetical protein DPMN_066556 [Dreissena polymorpha]|uniref:Uncharacterized protein n=1 Tax=Dreissena polymorpha TaxID=45954 RepID=A0A9D3YZ78_DREPO|nr:hypothetical protein DPMN_066556 [Dreissena polymorpha]